MWSFNVQRLFYVSGLTLIGTVAVLAGAIYMGIALPWQLEQQPNIELLLLAIGCLGAFIKSLPLSGILGIEFHRTDFRVKIEDVIYAYARAFEADNSGRFQSKQQLDSVFERMRHLRSLPELANMSDDILMLAAEMSDATRKLAAEYSNELIQQARSTIELAEKEVRNSEAMIDLIRKVRPELLAAARAVAEEGPIAKSRLRREVEHLVDEMARAGIPLQLQRPTEEVVTRLRPTTEQPQ
jgi:hypothetical protein